MSIVLPWPWQGRDKPLKERVAVVVVGHRRLAIATSEKGQLIGVDSPMACKAEVGFHLNGERLREGVGAHLSQTTPRRIVLLWTKPEDQTPLGRMFVMGQVRMGLDLLARTWGIPLQDELLEEIRLEALGPQDKTTIAQLVKVMRSTHSDLGEDAALAAAVAVLRTAPSPFRRRVSL